MLKINNVIKSYGPKLALNNVSIDISQGEIIGLFGENGAGKTTLMKSILGFIPIDRGDITLDGATIGPANYDRISFATCEHSFFASLNAKEHKEFYQLQFPKFNERRFDTLMEFFELPYKKPIRTFSTGQKNQFETILSLSQGADYIFMDEPFSGSDIFNRDDFYKVLLGILEPHETIILSTHLIEEIKHFIGRAILLRKGELIGDVSTEELDDNNLDVTSWIKTQYNYRANRVLEALQKSKL